ncbi:MAG: phosphotransferase, partial [Actinomycetota bacterium]|nr:phosphotransferase [Actinomycetota bacterium]
MVVSVQGRPSVVAGLRLVRPVGRGGEGEVWEVRDQRGRRRALKLIRPDVLADDAEARGRLLLRIDHPALVRVHRGGRLTAGPLAGWGFVEMDYVDGASLQNAPADSQVLDRLQPLAEALDLLHAGAWSAGLPLVHRDVKPANLIRTPDGRLVLVDPSTLRGVDATQLTRIGTPLFSAPEILTGRIGPAADVYSFAVTVLALSSGARGGRLADLVAEATAPHS